MKLIRKSINPETGRLSVKLEAHDSEDLWHIYNLLAIGDELTAPTIRKVTKESDTGSTRSDRFRMVLTICVTAFDFDAIGGEMRVSGNVVNGNNQVRNEAFHSIQIEPCRAFSITKHNWDSIAMDRLELALDPAADAQLGAVIMEEGLAHVLVVSRSLTITKARLEVNIPRKGKNAIFSRSSSLQKFNAVVLRAMLQHLDLDHLKVVIIASPGFVKDAFFEYAFLEASRHDIQELLKNKSKIILTHASSGHKHAFNEVLQRPELQSKLSQTGAAGDVMVMEKFRNTMLVDPDRAIYGPVHVKHAVEMGAVATLMVTDKMFRSSNVEMRKKLVSIVDDAKAGNATVHIFSTQHVTGEQLDMMTGVAALLRFPLPSLDDIDPSIGI